MHRPVVLLRTAAAPPAPPSGDLFADLRATRRHDASTRWVPLSAHVHDGALTDAARTAFHHGRGPTSLRLGLAFVRGRDVWLPHPAPGACSPTCGLTGDTLTPWFRAFVLAFSGSRCMVQLDEERFSLEPRADGDLRLRALEPDGAEESRLVLGRSPTLAALRAETAHLHALQRAMRDLDDPLPDADLDEAVRALHALSG